MDRAGLQFPSLECGVPPLPALATTSTRARTHHLPPMMPPIHPACHCGMATKRGKS